MLNAVIQEDITAIYQDLQEDLKKVEGSTWLISGGAGFLGSYFLDLLSFCNKEVFSRPCRVICVENFISGAPARIKHLEHDKHIQLIDADIVKPISIGGDIDYIVHAASIASPTFYRRFPLETIEANVIGLRNLLELGKGKDLQGFLFFSTSEIYGDPNPENIPTPEHYNGNVSCTGPRACYDESKRLGETLAVNYYQQHGLPVSTVRPFNIYGPGLRLDDKRVIPDFFSDALYKKKITVLSNGLPTRSFCYVRDGISGFMSALLSRHQGEAFNIGNDQLEISIKDLAEMIAVIVGDVDVEFGLSTESDYLIDNPQRRCPDLSKAKKLLGYRPKVGLQEGLTRTIKWYREIYNL